MHSPEWVADVEAEPADSLRIARVGPAAKSRKAYGRAEDLVHRILLEVGAVSASPKIVLTLSVWKLSSVAQVALVWVSQSRPA